MENTLGTRIDSGLLVSMAHPLRLSFYENSQDQIGIEWPSNTPHLQASLMDHWMKSENTSFITANKPPGYKVYFIAGSPLVFEHQNMKKYLEQMGLSFDEKIEIMREATVGLFRRRKIQKKAYWIFGSTDQCDVIAKIFDCYNVTWSGLSWEFIFLIANQEPPHWNEPLHMLSYWKKGGVIPADLIQHTQCIMQTESEYGMSLASNKIARETIERIALDIAKRHSRSLLVETIGRSQASRL